MYNLICERRSIRRFKQKLIPEEILVKLVNAARLAPSAANMQPLEYLILRGEGCFRFFPLLKWAGYIIPAGNPPKGKEPTAYVIILVNKKTRYPADKDVGAAAENIILAALSFGLGACWIDSVDRKTARALLKLPEHIELSSVIALGYPDESPVVEPVSEGIKYWKDELGVLHVPKRVLEDVLHFEGYGNKHDLYLEEKTSYSEISIYFDGASKGNPGRAGIGFIMYDIDGHEILSKSQYVGIKTNNEAEYLSLIAALTEVLNFSPRKVQIFSDSQLVVRQLTGRYRIKAPHLVKLASKARTLLSQIPEFHIEHIPREQNKCADKLANVGCVKKDGVN